MRTNALSLTIAFASILAWALPALAAVPAPPANQNIGIPDTVFDSLKEADCRLCHEDPSIVGPTSIPDRHHLLYGTTIPDPFPSYVVLKDPDANDDGVADTTFTCLNCHVEDTSTGVIVMTVFRDCLECHTGSPHHVTTWAQNYDCVHCHGTLVDNPVGCKEMQCAVASSSAGATRGVPLGISCTPASYPVDTSGAECATAGLGGGPVKVCGDTTQLCATDADCSGVGTGTCSAAAICGPFGGETACDDGHVIPTYDPSLVTPARSGHGHACAGTGTCSVSASACTVDGDCLTGACVATAHTSCNVDADCPGADTCVGGTGSVETCDGADACNYDTDCTEGTCSTTTTQTCHDTLDCPSGETCNGGVVCAQTYEEGLAGGCTYCHEAGEDSASGVLVSTQHDTHHGTGLTSGSRCVVCHMAGYPHTVYGEEPEHIRWCENCHGYEALHNIQVDSPNTANLGSIVVGGEDAGWGHIGNNDDCWGCHGFATAAAPGSGPLTPFISGADQLGVTAGVDTALTLNGAALTNLVGTYLWTSDLSMTGKEDGSSVTLTPDSVVNDQMAVTIPGTTPPGNYELRAVKGASAASNPLVISVKPEVAITDVSCDRKKGVLTVSGSGFGEKPAGTDAYINVQVNGEAVNITSWSDTAIKASVSECRGNAPITVNAVMGSATSGSNGGKPDKPGKGKK